MIKKSFLFCFFLLLICYTHPITTQANGLKKVFLLHSYHSGYKWTDDITSAVQNELYEKKVDLRIEHLDTKRYFTPQYLIQQKESLLKKYTNTQFDVVLVSDNHALNFALDFRTELFADTPIVFCGVNSFKQEMLKGHKNITGINESVDVRKTVDLMLSLHPETKRIVVINDESVTGTIFKKNFKESTQGKYPNIERVYTENFSAAELRELLLFLTPEDLVLLGVFFRDRNGQQFEYYESANFVTENSPVPVYGLFDFYLNHGIVGGYLTTGALQGQMGAKLVLDILNGKTADEIPVIMKSPNQYFADYSVIEKFDIKKDKFPRETIFINLQPQFYKDNKIAIWLTIAVVICLSVLTILLSTL